MSSVPSNDDMFVLEATGCCCYVEGGRADLRLDGNVAPAVRCDLCTKEV